MTHDHKQKPPPQSYPVRSISFVAASGLPGAVGHTELRGDLTQENAPRWTIEYIPAMRHHRVTFFAPQKEPVVRMVPEAVVRCWEPMT